MSSPAMLCKNNERGMRECDKDWKAKIEIQSTWEKKNILLYKPDDSIYTSRMIFRYIEDYKKMRKIDEMFYQINRIICSVIVPSVFPEEQFDFIYELEKETKKLLNLVKKCSFLI